MVAQSAWKVASFGLMLKGPVCLSNLSASAFVSQRNAIYAPDSGANLFKALRPLKEDSPNNYQRTVRFTRQPGDRFLSSISLCLIIQPPSSRTCPCARVAFLPVRNCGEDFFFRCYADAVAQAVLYAMFLAYPKSRIDFTEKFRKALAALAVGGGAREAAPHALSEKVLRLGLFGAPLGLDAGAWQV